MTEDYMEFVSNVKNKLGIDLTLYKEAQMKRRLTSLRDKNGYQSFHHYLAAIYQDESLLEEFLDRITINVSEFYRNPKRWEVLKSFILPQMVKRKQKLNIWSAACSTGEEPYSIAIMLKENFPGTDFYVLATDIDSRVLEKAKRAVYPEQSLKELPAGLKQKYFKQEHNGYSVHDAIKQHVQFKKHDLLVDEYPANIDLIICRNVLIYLTDKAKAVIYKKFTRSLKQKGVLFVGSTEQIFSPEQYGFTLMDTFFYQHYKD
ncbi:chemotaxis protein methyltransferase CheR [Lentibacillus halodurans]|uniref:protein-glutamate O-methyltransferase n=1 Tax=Lentibacillus halodurans TaxID=237679 RepID=A0A1I0VCM1_9BACI|nr:protein-glutamate O-methyltransferase CheR [Lentibacillus halodurans]SFA73797.1 chemotaxis protein methyltransferase CheR [Lentibacillus halodurans]